MVVGKIVQVGDELVARVSDIGRQDSQAVGSVDAKEHRSLQDVHRLSGSDIAVACRTPAQNQRRSAHAFNISSITACTVVQAVV